MIRAVLDTNIIASGFVGLGGAPDHILQRWVVGEFVLLLSDYILAELEKTLRKPYFSRMFPYARIDSELERFRAYGVVVALPYQLHGVASHSHDDRIIETAIWAMRTAS